MKRTLCKKCRTVATTAEDNMCTQCRRIWTRPSFDAAVEQVTAKQAKEICKMAREGAATTNIGAAMKRKYGPGPDGWDWHWSIVIAAHDRHHRDVLKSGW